MGKFYGTIGFAETSEVKPGVWEDQIVEKNVYGDLLKNSRRLEKSGNLNDDINISNQISIIADPYAQNNFHQIKYATFMSTRWKVTEVTVAFPRLILTLGGVYNGESGGN